MKLYFSGCAGTSERDMLVAAGVRDYLCDPTDYPNLPADRDSFAVDSGAYRAWKAGVELDINLWLETCQRVKEEPDFRIMPDVLGDWQATWARWRIVCEQGINCAPVWQWGAPMDTLDDLVSGNEIVCLGGLVPAMRAKDEKVLTEVTAICKDYGQRLHFLGLNWLRAMHQLMPLLKSADTSKWLDGGRYGSVFVPGPDGCLEQMHKTGAGRQAATREELCIDCARAMNDWVHGRLQAAPKREPDRIYVLGPARQYTPNRNQVAATNWTIIRSEADNRRRHEQAKERMASRGWK